MTNRDAWIALRDKLRGEQNLVIIFGSEIRGDDIARPGEVRLGDPGAKFVCLGDYANSRGAADMGLYPDLLPGYQRRRQYRHSSTRVGQRSHTHRGLTLPEMMESGQGREAESALRGRRESRGPSGDRSRSRSQRLSWSCRKCS